MTAKIQTMKAGFLQATGYGARIGFHWRSASRFFLLLLVLGICSVVGRTQQTILPSTTKALADEEVYFDAASKQAIQPGVLSEGQYSATSIGNVLSVLFDSAKVDLQTANDGLTGTWLGTVRVATKPGAKPKTSYLQHLRYSVEKTPGTRVSIVVELGGKTFTRTFPYGTTRSGNITGQFISPVLKQAGGYTATILIIAERRDANSAVLVTVDGLDVEARPPFKKKNK